MACVLCDGSAASLKAIDLAVIPQLVLRQHKDEQLILIHGFEDASGVINANLPPNMAQLHQQAANLQAVIGATLEQIEKNKFAKDSLNYKIEMIRTTRNVPQTIAAAAPAAPAAGGRAATPTGGSKPGTAAKGAPIPVAVHPNEAESTPTPPEIPSAETLAAYVAKRADHHHVRSFLLGVGNQSNGKAHTVGQTAKELYLQQSGAKRRGDEASGHAADWSLWYVKPTAATLRPGASVKFLVLLDANTQTSRPLLALRYTLRHLVQPSRGDRVSVLIIANNNVSMEVATPGRTDVVDVTENVDRMTAVVNEELEAAGIRDESTQEVPKDEDAQEATAHNPSPPSALPLVSYLQLEGNNANPRPNINDVPQQLLKSLAKLKSDFLVVPPTGHGTLSEATVMLLLGSLRPHVIIPPSILLEGV